MQFIPMIFRSTKPSGAHPLQVANLMKAKFVFAERMGISMASGSRFSIAS